MDAIVCLGPNDEDIIAYCISSLYKYVEDIRNIYVISHREMDISGAIVVPESAFPFTKADCVKATKEDRGGWYLQQLLKLYAPLLIKNCSETCLIVDADTVFHKRTKFRQGDKVLMNKTFELHPPYFDHMKRLHPSFVAWKKQTSGIVNCMPVLKGVIQELMTMVEDYHDNKPFWQVFLECVSKEWIGVGASEYEIYYHYLMRMHKDKVIERPLQFSNFGQRMELAMGKVGDWHYVSYHWHVQKKRKV
jgi:hypothetical protein